MNLVGWAIGSGLLVAYALFAINLFITFPLMIILEERELAARFGNSYREYQRTVPLLPFFRTGKGNGVKQSSTGTEPA